MATRERARERRHSRATLGLAVVLIGLIVLAAVEAAHAGQPRYREQYVKCRAALLLKAPAHKGTYQDARKCWRSHYVIPAWPWAALARCEAGDQGHVPRHPKRVFASRLAQWSIDAYHDGGLQFLPSTWTKAIHRFGIAHVMPPLAYQASPRQQVIVARKWLRVTSWRQWPVCSARIGAR